MNHSRTCWLCYLLSVLLLLSLTVPLQADGKYYPEKVYKTPPRIPHQRAIIVYKDGIEKLIIESELSGPGQEFGWIIPLPAKPLTFEKSTPGLIKTLELKLQPEIVHDSRKSLPSIISMVVFFTIVFLIFMYNKPKNLMAKVLCILIIAILSSVGLPVMMGGLSSAYEMIAVHQMQEVGSYQLAVLEARDADGLDTWLRENSYAGLDISDKQVIEDYIKENWYFVAARLKREGEGLSRPHPLAMTFPTQQVIYPLRLTGTVGSDVYLDLFVICDKKAQCERLILECSDTFQLRHKKSYYGNSITSELPWYQGIVHNIDIGHPQAIDLMWDGCFISRLSGTLTPQLMQTDLVLSLVKGDAQRKCYYSQQGAILTAISFCSFIWCISLIILLFVAYFRYKTQEKQKAMLDKAGKQLLVILLLIVIPIYLALPKVKVQTHRLSKHIHFVTWRMNLDYLKETFQENQQLKQIQDKDIMAQKVLEIINEVSDSHLDYDIKEEDSPFNFTVEKDETGLFIRFYDEGGFPIDISLNPDSQE
ncbi:MAG: DUF2330 domain-containing protein [Sedimentisphaerales bacterium]|nr:DUF2330 domain-containing protein [Sedimentisphaerales bacterium]